MPQRFAVLSSLFYFCFSYHTIVHVVDETRKYGNYNYVLPLKAARCDAISNLKCFGVPGHQQPNVDGFIYIHCAAAPYSARISAIYLLPFGKVWFGSVCRVQPPGNEAERKI